MIQSKPLQTKHDFSKRSIAFRKEKLGRWSYAECYLFQSLLQRYGKNWRKIQEHMKNRSLSQIRSHAQKYFDKVGPKKVQEFQRRAKLLEAYQILSKLNQHKKQIVSQSVVNLTNTDLEIKRAEKSPPTQEAAILENSSIQVQKESTILQEQSVKPSENIKEDKLQQNYYPFLNSFYPFDTGYLFQIAGQYPQPYYQFQEFEPMLTILNSEPQYSKIE